MSTLTNDEVNRRLAELMKLQNCEPDFCNPNCPHCWRVQLVEMVPDGLKWSNFVTHLISDGPRSAAFDLLTVSPEILARAALAAMEGV